MLYIRNVVSVLAVVLFVAVLAGCSSRENTPGAGNTTREKPEDQDPMGGTGPDSKELLDMCDQMMRSILACDVIAKAPKAPTVALLDVANDTSFRINKNILLQKLEANLMQHASGKILFIERSRSDEIERERIAKRDGRVDFDPAKYREAMAGVDYFLTGTMTGISKRDTSGMASDYILCIFKLVDAESGVVLWEGQYEFKKVALDNVMYH
jgi:hypothetical protein